MRIGARLGYDGPRKSKFSKNLKSAIDNPTIVSNNLAKEVALGHTAGELLGMVDRNNSYYFDKVLPFGLRSAPYIFNQLSDALEWILLNKCFISYEHTRRLSYHGTPNSSWATFSSMPNDLSSMLLTFNTLGVSIAEHKTEGPNLIIEFLGIILDSQKMEARLPPDKLNRLSIELDAWHIKKSATLQELQSLIGTLNFACKVIPPGRAYLQRIINLTRGVPKSHHHIRLTNSFREDVKM